MKKALSLLILIIILSTSLSALDQAGTGISVFVPESLYQYGNGSVSLEQSLEFALGLGSMLSLPVGVTYNTNYGLMVQGEDQAENPWFYSDSLMPYVMLKLTLPLGPFYFDLFGGGAMNYNFTLRAMEGNIEKDLSDGSRQAVVEDGTMEFDRLLGFGYLAGAGFGFTFDRISIEISALFRNIVHDLNMTADYADFSEESPGSAYDPGEEVKLLMRGISVGLGGKFAF